jgi:hypothetical protein
MERKAAFRASVFRILTTEFPLSKFLTIPSGNSLGFPPIDGYVRTNSSHCTSIVERVENPYLKMVDCCNVRYITFDMDSILELWIGLRNDLRWKDVKDYLL